MSASLLLALGTALVAWVVARRERRARRLLEVSRNRSAALLAQLPDVTVLVFDRDLRYTQVEGGAIEAHGGRPAELLGRRMPDVLPPDRVTALLPSYEAGLGCWTPRARRRCPPTRSRCARRRTGSARARSATGG